jgi:hypothetical protein
MYTGCPFAEHAVSLGAAARAPMAIETGLSEAEAEEFAAMLNEKAKTPVLMAG